MKHVEFVAIIDNGVRKRHIHIIERGKVTSFVVQLETKVGDSWLPVVRYDNAHGKAHIDLFSITGKKEKTFLELDFNAALTLADWDINNNWENYLRDFMRDKQ